jgi:hypothetical protein
MADKHDPTTEPTAQTDQTTSPMASRPIIVKDEAELDTKKVQTAEAKIEQPKVSVHAKVSAPAAEDKTEVDQASEEERQPLRKSAPAVIAPLEPSERTKDEPSNTEAEAVEESPEVGDKEPKTEETTVEKVADKMKQTDKHEQDYEKLEKRLQEIERTIESRKYFVPINTVAQKRSIRVSLILVLLTLLLAVLLIDLMFDSGVILLVNRLPHTHFFNVH